MRFKDISYKELWRPFSSAEHDHICNFGRRHQEEQFCEIILNLDQWISRRCCLKLFLIWSSGRSFVQRSKTICAIYAEGIMRNNSVKLFEFGPVVQGEMRFKDISYLELWRPFCSAEQNHLCNLVKGIM